jgi:alpha-L-fucosidase 2
MCEWLWPGLEDRYKHRHLSHIYPLFPGFEITEESDPAFYEACRVAVEKRLVVGLNAQVGWSYAHMISIYARLGQSGRALECLSLLARSSTKPNLLTAIGDWRDMGLTWDVPNPPFQIDANFGITAGILEMLVFSVPGMIKPLPALPADWPRGSITGVRCRGGVTVDVAWDTGRLDVSLIADAAQMVTVKFPAPPETLESQAKISESAHGPAYREVVLPAGEVVKMALVLAV